MRRYLTLSRAEVVRDDDFEATTAGTVYERDDAPEFTGLYDQHGNRLYAVQEREPIGFRIRS